MATRRSFLSMIGLAPVAAISHGVPMDHADFPPPSAGYAISHATDNTVAEKAARAWFKSNGVPEFLKDNIRRNRREYSHEHRSFDADIDSAKSFSLATKRRLQIERQVERTVQGEFGRWNFEERRDGIKSMFNGFWPFWNI